MMVIVMMVTVLMMVSVLMMVIVMMLIVLVVVMVIVLMMVIVMMVIVLVKVMVMVMAMMLVLVMVMAMVMVMVIVMVMVTVMVMVPKALSQVGWLHRCQTQSINRLWRLFHQQNIKWFAMYHWTTLQLSSHNVVFRCFQMLPHRLNAKRCALRCFETMFLVLHNALRVAQQNIRIPWTVYSCLQNATKSNY